MLEIDTIKELHRTRNYLMEQRKASMLRLGAHIRTTLGWSLEKTAAERKAIEKEAARLIEIGEKVAKNKKSKPIEGVDDPAYLKFEMVIASTLVSLKSLGDTEGVVTDRLETLAEGLPVWAHSAQDMKGFTPRSLGVIVGMAGDLSGYANPGKLWKRMGLAPHQGKAGSTWRCQGGLSKEGWIEIGYNPVRRASMYVIAENLIQRERHYHDLFAERKAYEKLKADEAGLQVLPSAKITKNNAAKSISLGQIHARAHRYVAKRLLRDLWVAWREATALLKSETTVPPALLLDKAA